MNGSLRRCLAVVGWGLLYGSAATAGVASASMMPVWANVAFILAALGLMGVLILVGLSRGGRFGRWSDLPSRPKLADLFVFVLVWSLIGYALGILPERSDLWASAAIVVVATAMGVAMGLHRQRSGAGTGAAPGCDEAERSSGE